MSPLPPDTDPLEYGNQFLKPRSALGLSLSGHDGTSKHKTNDRQGTGPLQTSSFSLHPHPLDHKLPPLAWVQSLVQKGHPSCPKPDENIKAGNGHAPGPELSSGSESHYSSNGQSIPLANSSNSDSIKRFVDRASQNGIRVNGNGGKPGLLGTPCIPKQHTNLSSPVSSWQNIHLRLQTQPPPPRLLRQARSRSITLASCTSNLARKLVYPEQSSNLHGSGNDEQATMSHDPRKTRYHYQGSVGPRGGHTTHFPVNTTSSPPVYPGWRPSLPTLEGEASDSSTAATEPNPWEETKSPQSSVHPPQPQGFQPSPNHFDRPSNQVRPNLICSPAFYGKGTIHAQFNLSLSYLLLMLQKHEHLGIILEILPPPEELSRFNFESEQYLLSVTPCDPPTPPLSPSFTPSDTDSSEVEIILKGEPEELPTLDPEAIHEAPVKSNLS
ncbi:hypothetical protein BS47DRAFT_1396460 [Hydnum rufescens UP504]|uniref:Uncharacterized protein n=1 Tax=Hydnum rufescens UP504 TaxID=1448309 RepID=A0A9P6AR51_9AGAM|nr:hypothetical protein BS47DRAFT_1396460 [Hydnum rufescens UP504]